MPGFGSIYSRQIAPGQGQGIGCAVEVRGRPELFRVVVRIDKGFETTGHEPWTYLLTYPAASTLAFLGVLGRKNSGTSKALLTLPQQRLHYSPRLLPIPPTHTLNGSSLGRPDVDLMFAKWAFNIVAYATEQLREGPSSSCCVVVSVYQPRGLECGMADAL
eukprot:scaffold24017_cov82-Phaeocystis_antarctica.AAC.1